MSTGAIRFVRRHFVVLAVVAALLAVGVNILAPFWKISPSAAHTPQASPAWTAVERAFPGTGTDNVAYVVFETQRPLNATAMAQVAAVADELRRHPEAVSSVLDMSTDPLTAPIAQSQDRRATYIRAWLIGAVGSAEGFRSLGTMRDAVDAVPNTGNLRIHLTGPAVDGANAAHSASAALTWVLGGVVVAMFVAALVLTGSAALCGAVLLIALVSLAISLPVESLGSPLWVGQTITTSLVWTVALTIGAALHYTLMLLRNYRIHLQHGGDHETALVGAYRNATGTIVTSAALVAGTLLMAEAAGVPELYGIGIAAGVGVIVAMMLVLILAPAWTIRFGSRRLQPRITAPTAYRSLAPTFRRPWKALIGTAAVVIAGLAAMQTIHIGADVTDRDGRQIGTDRGYLAARGHFGDDRLSPQAVLIESDYDLRTPAGLIAIDRVTRRLMEIPDVRMVQSASAPAGLPWPDATLAHQLGELNRQLQSQGTSALPLTDSLDQLPATFDQLTASLDRFERVINTSTAALSPASASLNEVVSSLKSIDATATWLSRYADPLRQWITTVPDCPADLVCSAARKVVDPLDNVLAQTSAIATNSKRLSANITTASEGLSNVRAALADTRRALDKIRPLVVGVAGTAGDFSPGLARVTTFINSLTADLNANGVGGFYLPQRAIEDPSYAGVKATLFSEDGHATRLFVYGTGGSGIAEAIMPSIQETTKFGPLQGSSAVTVGVSSTAADIDSHWLPDLRNLLLLCGLTIMAVSAVALRNVLLGLLIAVAIVVCYLATLGLFALFWCGVMGAEIDWWAPHVAFVVAAAVMAEDAWRATRRFAGRCPVTSPGRGHALIVAGVVWCIATMGATATVSGTLNQASCLAALSILVCYLTFRIGVITAAGLVYRRRLLNSVVQASARPARSTPTTSRRTTAAD